MEAKEIPSSNLSDPFSNGSEAVGTTLEDRLANIERMIEGIGSRLEKQNLAAHQKNLFLWIVAAHSLSVVACLLYAEYLLYGLAVGCTTTLGVWHAISLRSFWGRWSRSILASLSVLVPFCIASSFQIKDIGYLLGIVFLFFGGAATITRLFAMYSQSWLWAPDLPPPTPRPVSIKSLMAISLVAACLFAICRLISAKLGSQDPTAAGYAAAILVYGGISGLLFNAYLFVFGRLSCWKRQAMGALLLFFVSLLVNISGLPIASLFLDAGSMSGLNNWQSLPNMLPIFCIYTLCGVGSPLITFYVLLQNGQEFVALSESHGP